MYPNEQHSINGKQVHLYHKLDDFFKNCFDEITRRGDI